MEQIDISKLDKKSQEIVLRFCELAKENEALRRAIKELSKLIWKEVNSKWK